MNTASSGLPMHQRRGGAASTRTQGTNNGHFNNNMHNRGMGDLERGGRGSGSMSAGEANRSIMEQQNNERIDELSQQVARLKGLTIDIGNEVREQNSLLDNMGSGFESTRDMLSGSLRRIGTMLESGGAKHMCYMVTFVVFVMIFLYWVMSYKGTNGA